MVKEEVIQKIKSELEIIDNKKNQILFFVIDTKGQPSGSLEYIYKMAKTIQDNGYNVTMLYQVGANEEFVGVESWLGSEYASLPHANAGDGNINVSPSDILFIPEIFANVMTHTKKLPCKRVAILQNYDYMVEQMPFSVQWGDLGIMDCITNTEANKEKIHDVFPYVRTTVVPPSIDNIFGTTSEPKKLIVNIVSRNQSNINKLIKPFYWKHPYLKFVSFRELRDLSKEEFAKALREAAITIYIDETASFGYTALEAVKSGNIVMAKTTENNLGWGDDNDAVIWFDSFSDAHKMIASIVRAWVTDKIPAKIAKDGKKVVEEYNEERFQKGVIDFLTNIIANRRTEIENLLKTDKDESN